MISMKTILLSVLVALALAGPSQGARLYSTNLGNGITELGGLSALTSGTVRFGVFPADFDFAANSENYSALNSAFTEVCSYTGPISVNSVNGFFDLAISYDTAATYEGVPYDNSAGSTNPASGDIAGDKVYIWLLNSATPSSATQQAIFSAGQRWSDADELVADTFVSPDSGSLELVAHLGSLANGNNIGAGASSHTASGALIAPVGIVTVNPATAQVLAGSRVVFTVNITSGTPPITRQWRRNGVDIPGATGATYSIATASLTSRATYDCVLRNGTNVDVPTNGVFLNVVTPRPTIATPPASTIVGTGESATFNVSAVAAGTLSYSWRRGTSVLSTNSSLTITPATLADAGAFTVTASNTPGAGTGSATGTANLVVVNQSNTTFVAQANARGTTTATIQVVTAGTGISGYQWFLSSDLLNPIEDGVKYAGSRTARLTIKNLSLSDSDAYVCFVSAYGSSKKSGNVNLIVYNTPPSLGSITLQQGIVGGFYSYQIPQALLPDSSNIAESFTASPLPAGLTLNSATGVISGYPTAATTSATKPIRITARNKSGTSAFVDAPIIINPLPTGVAGVYEGPIQRGPVLGGELGGRYDMTVTPTGTVTGKLTLGTTVLPFAHRLTITGTNPLAAVVSGNISVRRLSGAPYQLTFVVHNGLLVGADDGNSETNDLALVSLGAASQPFEAWRQAWAANPEAARALAFAHRYNVAIGIREGSASFGDSALAPQGIGFFSFTVANNGKLTFDGSLPDGEKITGPAFLGPNGQLFIFRTLYNTAQKGSLLARFNISRHTNLTSPADNRVDGTASWNRPQNLAASNRLYRNGFNVADMTIAGGAYTLSSNASGLALDVAANGLVNLTFEDANVGVVGRNNPNAQVRIITATRHEVLNRLDANSRTALPALTQPTGVFAGSFISQGTSPTAFTGLIVPISGVHTGLGYFLLNQTGTPATQQSGSVSLEKVIAP
jgi:hypothetical protein